MEADKIIKVIRHKFPGKDVLVVSDKDGVIEKWGGELSQPTEAELAQYEQEYDEAEAVKETEDRKDRKVLKKIRKYLKLLMKIEYEREIDGVVTQETKNQLKKIVEDNEIT